MKKIISLILVVMMLATMAVSASAATYDDPDAPKISIDKFSSANVYTIYKMLNLSMSSDGKAYTYTIVPGWEDFFASADAQQYIKINAAGAVEWIASDEESVSAAFAKKALEYAEATPEVTAVRSSTEPGDSKTSGTTLIFPNLDLGYYLVDSTMGALCGLTTTAPNATIEAKNAPPTIEKQVFEDSTKQWLSSNTADIGQIIEYRVTVDVHAGAQNYVLHDTMDPGVDFYYNDTLMDETATDINNPVLKYFKVQHTRPGSFDHYAPASKYDLVLAGEKDAEDNVIITDGCAFHIVFDPDFCNEMQTNDKIVIYYAGVLNRNAKVYTDMNKNTAWMTFGQSQNDNDPHKSNESTVSTGTAYVDIVKTDKDKNMLPGATFRIYDADGSKNADGTINTGNEIKVVATTDADGNTYYIRNASIDDDDDQPGALIAATNGKATIVGLDNGTYYLQEIDAPEGYNPLTARQAFTVSDANMVADINGTVWESGGVRVINNTGTMLPQTGAAGTMMFITFGMLTVLATGVLLVTKKRMSMIEE